MTTAIEIFHTNKRKFVSDLEGFPSSSRFCQEDSSCNAKKVKVSEPERLPTPIVEIEETEQMMIDEKSNPQQIGAMTKSPAMIIPKHCNGICDADASPTTFIMRCYCDPYRLNGLLPYHSDIY